MILTFWLLKMMLTFTFTFSKYVWILHNYAIHFILAKLKLAFCLMYLKVDLSNIAQICLINSVSLPYFHLYFDTRLNPIYSLHIDLNSFLVLRLWLKPTVSMLRSDIHPSFWRMNVVVGFTPLFSAGVGYSCTYTVSVFLNSLSGFFTLYSEFFPYIRHVRTFREMSQKWAKTTLIKIFLTIPAK